MTALSCARHNDFLLSRRSVSTRLKRLETVAVEESNRPLKIEFACEYYGHRHIVAVSQGFDGREYEEWPGLPTAIHGSSLTWFCWNT
jgi:hypothetical protein